MLATQSYSNSDERTLIGLMPGLPELMLEVGLDPTEYNARILLDRWGSPVEFEKGAPLVSAALKLQADQPVPTRVLGDILRTGVMDRVPMRTVTGLSFPDRPIDVYVGGATVFWMERRYAELELMMAQGLQVREVYASGTPTRKAGLASEVINPHVASFHEVHGEYPSEFDVATELYQEFTARHGFTQQQVIAGSKSPEQVAQLPDSVTDGLYVVTNANAHYNGLAVRRLLRERFDGFDVAGSGLWWSGDSFPLAMTNAGTTLPRDCQNPLTVICGDVPRMTWELLELGVPFGM